VTPALIESAPVSIVRDPGVDWHRRSWGEIIERLMGASDPEMLSKGADEIGARPSGSGLSLLRASR